MSTEREYNEWIEMRWMDDTSKSTRILLIGDSIVVQHGTMLHEMLKDAYCVDYFATSKIASDKDYLRDLEFMLNRMKYAMIIANNGLHGFPVSDEEYAAGLKNLVKRLKNCNSILVWRNCTPCYVTAPENWAERVPLRNAMAEKIMNEAGIPVFDAFSLLNGKRELSRDGVHFKGEGCQILADAEAALIRKTLEKN